MTKQELTKRLEHDPFFDSSVNLDYPTIDLSQPTKCDDPLECAVREVGIQKDLKHFVGNLANDPEALNELKRTHPELAAQIDESKPKQFYAGDWLCSITKQGEAFRVIAVNQATQVTKHLNLAASDLDEAMLLASRILTKPKRQLWRELTPEQELTVIRFCQMKDVQSAILTYITYAVGGFTDSDISTNPKYLPLANKIAWFVFEHSTPDFSDEARPFMEEFCGDRPLTVDLLRSAFVAYQKKQGFAERDRLLGFDSHNEPEASDHEFEDVLQKLNDMEDGEIDSLYRSTSRDIVKNRKRTPGILQ